MLAEINERALLYSNEALLHCKISSKGSELKEFVAEILGPDDDITHFEYTKKTNRENGAAVVGIQLKSSDDLAPLVSRMKSHNFMEIILMTNPTFSNLLYR